MAISAAGSSVARVDCLSYGPSFFECAVDYHGQLEPASNKKQIPLSGVTVVSFLSVISFKVVDISQSFLAIDDCGCFHIVQDEGCCVTSRMEDLAGSRISWLQGVNYNPL
jgi:hypothetical protein